MDPRILAVEWKQLRLGIRPMDSAAANRGCLGRRPLDAEVRWLGLDGRLLARMIPVKTGSGHGLRARR